MNQAREIKEKSKLFYNTAAEVLIGRKAGQEFHGGVPFSIRAAECIRGYRTCTLLLDCGFDNDRLLHKLTPAALPQLVPWACQVPPSTYLSGRYVAIDAAWPPELQRANVRLDDISSPTTRHGGRLIIGPDSVGENVTLPSLSIEHLLIAGQTGSGKSFTMRSLGAQLSVQPAHHPPNLLVLLDGKGGEGLRIVDRLPGQVGPLATTVDGAVNALGWCVTEMRQRYEQISDNGGLRANGDLRHLYILFDEFQMWTHEMAHPGIIELLQRLATQGRAAGVHVIAGTQKPKVDVFGKRTSTSGQFSAAIGQRVKSFQESKMIVGGNEPRCDHLLAKGDAHVVASVPDLVQERVQVAYFSEQQLAEMPRAETMYQEWPAYDAGKLGQRSPVGRRAKVTTNEELAVGLEAALDGHGTPWYRKQFDSGCAPGAGRVKRIVTRCEDLLLCLRERGLRLRRG